MVLQWGRGQAKATRRAEPCSDVGSLSWLCEDRDPSLAARRRESKCKTANDVRTETVGIGDCGLNSQF
jgi:hypothetical protein